MRQRRCGLVWKKLASTSSRWKTLASDINQKHPFISVIVIAVMAVLAGRGRPHRDCQMGGVSSGVPAGGIWCCPTAFRRKMSFCGFCRHFSQKLFRHLFLRSGWKRCGGRVEETIGSLSTRPWRSTVARCGGSHDQKERAGPHLHSVGVWAADFGMTLAQTACEEKSNEIAAIPELLKLVHIQGSHHHH